MQNKFIIEKLDDNYSYAKNNSKLACITVPVIFLLFLLWHSPVEADNVITSGANVSIGSGVFVSMVQNVVIENGGGLAIEGSLILLNNFTNQNTVDTLGSGTIEFSGTTPQNISGQNTIGSLSVNNAAGLDVSGNTMIDTLLNLQNGLIRLDSNNLTLGSLAIVTGVPSVSAMVIATGTGELRKSFSETRVFTFPVGDTSGIAEYSPVTINFAIGIFSPGNYIGVKLTNSAYPGLTGNYLKRYWTVNQNGITSPQYDVLFQYLPDDIYGAESEIYCIKVEPLPVVTYNPANTTLHQLTANELTIFGIFTGGVGIPPNLPLYNLTLTDGTTECFNALDTITVAGVGTSVEFLNGSTVDLIAGQTIIILPGFHAESGSNVHASITLTGTFCDGASASIVEQPMVKSSEEKPTPEKQAISQEEKSIKVFPNPNNGQFTLELTNIESGATVCIYNILGARVYESSATNEGNHKINLPGIQRGIYFVKVSNGKEHFTKKVIVK